MNLPKPQLDDKTFAQLMEDVTKLIPQYAPEWTDFNKHDPGITFLELFAALTEQQRYYLDRIQDSSLLKFLKLLGIQPKDFTSARIEVSFSRKENSQLEPSLLIPNGTQLQFSSPNSEDVIFETEADLDFWMANTDLTKVITFSTSEVKDNTGANDDNKGLSFKAFGESAEQGSRLYLGFKDLKFSAPFPPNKPIGITFDLFEDSQVPLGNHGDEPIEIQQSVQLDWEYSASGDRWKKLEIDKDETNELTKSGRLYFVAPNDMKKQGLIPLVSEDLYWIRATVSKDGYEIPPEINTIRLNTISAIQQQTLAKSCTFSSNGQLIQSFAAPYLALVGETILQIGVGEGLWQHCRSSRIDLDRENYQITLNFDESERPPRGHDNIRLICYQSNWRSRFELNLSNGLPNQSFQVEIKQDILPIVTKSFALQVEIKQNIWQDWQRIQDFDVSLPEEQHYTLNTQTGRIIFGDGINGQIPTSSSRIRIISYQTSQPEKGNVKAEVDIRLVESRLLDLQSLEMKIHQAATGGAIAESLEQAQLRARKQLRTPFRAVTSADFENLALATPGLRVARAKVIPSLSSTELKQANLVEVVVVPCSPLMPPKPSEGFLKTVEKHLKKHRLITTKIVVISPDYVEIIVVATVCSKPGFLERDTRDSIEKKLNQFLNPLKGGGVSAEGWEFGRTVYQSEIYAAIESIDAVDCVRSLALNFEGASAFRDNKDNIQLTSLQCLVYALKHNITIETSDRLLGGRRI